MLNLNSYWLLKTTTSHDFILWSCDSWIVAFPVTGSLARTYASNLLTLYLKLWKELLRGQIIPSEVIRTHLILSTSQTEFQPLLIKNGSPWTVVWVISILFVTDIIYWLNQWIPTGLSHIHNCNHFQKYGQVSLIKKRKDLIETLWPIENKPMITRTGYWANNKPIFSSRAGYCPFYQATSCNSCIATPQTLSCIQYL